MSCCRAGLSVNRQHVTGTANGLQKPGLLRVGFDLSPEPGDLNIDRSLLSLTPVPTQVLDQLRPDDLALFTADHGNDPTWVGTDHTRERVPVLGAGCGQKEIGHVGFVDVAASVADHLGLSERGPGRSFL